MLTSDFDYHLPQERIAQTPCEPRDHSRLMVVDRRAKTRLDKHFFDIIDHLRPGDLLVWNNSKVFKARLFGVPMLNEAVVKPPEESSDVILNNRRRIEVFLVRPMENPGVWKVLAKPGRKLHLGMKVVFADDFWCEVLVKENDGTLLVQFPSSQEEVRTKANRYGEVPLPPYVAPIAGQAIGERYQTVYAKHEGSVAAPTAGFHFTPELIEKIKTKGVEFAEVTLHVGLGTFLPVKTERVEDHAMHSEWVELSPEAAARINRAKTEGRRVIAVGTTSVRVLEGLALEQGFNGKNRPLAPFSGDLNLFITPGFTFRIIDALITNFHLPQSTLLMLVAAFIGDTRFTLECYQAAVRDEYRFYSFGDAMFIH